MPQLTDQELEGLLKGGESESVEFCASPENTRDKIAQNICAFANDLPGAKKPGVMFIGVKDDGSCAGLSVTDKMLQPIAQIKNDRKFSFPPVVNSVRKAVLNQCEVIIIEVQPSKNPPLRHNGRCWIRSGPTVQQASQPEEIRLTEKKANLPFDMRGMTNASESDLNLRYFKEAYLPGAVSAKTLKANKRDLKHQMRALKMLDKDAFPTAAALLVMGKAPQQWLPCAYVQFIRFEGKAITDPVKSQKEISGTLPEQIQRLEEIVEANISESLALSKLTHAKSADYPAEALNQLLRNAVMHRLYEDCQTQVFFRWFSDRIEVQSPGGPYGQVNKKNFGSGEQTAYRNPVIAEALKTLGFIERFGFGIPKAKEALKKNGNPEPDFLVEESHVLVTVRPRRA